VSDPVARRRDETLRLFAVPLIVVETTVSTIFLWMPFHLEVRTFGVSGRLEPASPYIYIAAYPTKFG
jgi:hypothetical protein